MEQLLLVAPIAVPVLFWAVYHYYTDRHLPEPLGHLLLAFGLGLVAVFLSSALYAGLGVVGLRHDAGHLADTSTWALLAYALLAIGPVEELAKLLPFVLVVLRFRELDEPMDGIIYASFIGLGYAALENWQYLEYLTKTEALARGFASPVIHILFASIWGHWIARAHLAGRTIWPAALASFALAALLHGLYDFLVILNAGYALPAAALGIVYLWWWRLRLLRALQRGTPQER